MKLFELFGTTFREGTLANEIGAGSWKSKEPRLTKQSGTGMPQTCLESQASGDNLCGEHASGVWVLVKGFV